MSTNEMTEKDALLIPLIEKQVLASVPRPNEEAMQKWFKGLVLQDDYRFCDHCGHRIADDAHAFLDYPFKYRHFTGDCTA